MKIEIPNEVSAKVYGLIGRGVQSVSVDDDKNLIFTLTDGSEYDLGNIAGAKGDTGPTGATGAQGEKGEKGETGATGPQGLKGETGAQGIQGPKGDTGDIGPQGEKGDKGDTGKGIQLLGTYSSVTALESAVTAPNIGDMYNVGATYPYNIYMWDGTTWKNQGQLQGPAGPAGPKGEKGETGEQGVRGLQGDHGEAGPQGPQGIQGLQGMQGEKGDTGERGATGLQGPAGANGSDGVSCTHSWSGTTLIVTSASGTSSANLKGEKGEKGNTGAQGETGPVGPAGADGSDANVTAANIQTALGFAPQAKVQTATVLPASGTALAENTLYNVSDFVGTYDFVAPTTGWAHGKFTTGSTVAVSFSGTFLSSAPTVEADTTYEFDVLDGVWAVVEVVTA